MTRQCPACLGRYGGPHTHSHTSAAVFDERFADCQGCHGKGAMTCETCLGSGLVDINGQPALEDAANVSSMRLRGMQATPKGMSPRRPDSPSDGQRMKNLVAKAIQEDYKPR